MIYAYFDPEQFRKVLSNLDQLKHAIVEMGTTLPKAYAVEAMQLLIGNIQSRKYGDFGQPYIPRYLRWKRIQTGVVSGDPTPWKLFGALVNSISVIPIDYKTVGAGIPAEAAYVNAMLNVVKNINDYAFSIEFGYGGIPARPLFRWTLRDMFPEKRQELDYYFPKIMFEAWQE